MLLKEEQRSSLSSCKVCPGTEVTFVNQQTSVAVSDMDQVTDFYEGKLGFAAGEDQPDDSRVYACGGGTSLHIHVSPVHAGKATSTVATWYVADLEQVVDELIANGVTFERYEESSLKSDDKGIHTLDDGRVTWFKDPDGNTFALEE